MYHKKLKLWQSTSYLLDTRHRSNKKEFKECTKTAGFRSAGHSCYILLSVMTCFFTTKQTQTVFFFKLYNLLIVTIPPYHQEEEIPSVHPSSLYQPFFHVALVRYRVVWPRWDYVLHDENTSCMVLKCRCSD